LNFASPRFTKSEDGNKKLLRSSGFCIITPGCQGISAANIPDPESRRRSTNFCDFYSPPVFLLFLKRTFYTAFEIGITFSENVFWSASIIKINKTP
jgi:hypothetical protein